MGTPQGVATGDDDRLSRMFAALADPTRRDIVARLAEGEATVGELARPYPLSMQAVSKHLRVLEDAGLVSRSREAQRRPCRLEADVLDLMGAWIERYRRAAEDRFRRLDAVLADTDPHGPPGDASPGGAHAGDSAGGGATIPQHRRNVS